jgi:hypothetical protein
MTAARRRNPAEESIVEFLGTIAGRAGIKHITGDKQGIDLFIFNGLSQPIQKR